MPSEVFLTFGEHIVAVYYAISTNRDLSLLPTSLDNV